MLNDQCLGGPYMMYGPTGKIEGIVFHSNTIYDYLSCKFVLYIFLHMPGKKWESANYCTMGSGAVDVVMHPQELTEGTSFPKTTMSQPPTCQQLMTRPKQLKACFLPRTLDVSPCSYLPMQPSPWHAPQRSWHRLEGTLPWDKAERETGETKFSDLILVMWIIVILSWSNLYPTQVPWEEEATAAQEPPLAIQPSALWTQLRICLRHT